MEMKKSNVLIVYAHPEPKSFNGALKNLAIEVLREQGHEVKVSDLYAMNFKAAADQSDFTHEIDPEFFSYIKEQKNAVENMTFAPDILGELEKVKWADIVIFQYPLWWTERPAILKGWIDRILVNGIAYGGGGIYDKGHWKNKKAMLSFTTSGGDGLYGPDKIKGKLEERLFNFQHEALYFCGMNIIEPFIAWSPQWVGEEGRSELIEAYRNRLLSLETLPTIPFLTMADYEKETAKA